MSSGEDLDTADLDEKLRKWRAPLVWAAIIGLTPFLYFFLFPAILLIATATIRFFLIRQSGSRM